MTRRESDGLDPIVTDDLRALGKASLRRLPEPDLTPPAHRAGRFTLKEMWMTPVHAFVRRPGLAVAGVVAAVTLALLMIPMTYVRTTGYEARLTLGPSTPAAVAQKVATEFGRALHARNLSVSENAGAGHEIVAQVSGKAGGAVAAGARGFARVLNSRDIPATVSVSPITEKVSTSLLAYAAEQVVEIRINAQGKTDAQVEQEIRSQLEAAGIQNAQISFSRTGDQTHIQIQADGKGDGSGGDKKLQLSVNEQGAPQSGKIEVMLPPDHHMSDVELKAYVEQQLRDKGIDAQVDVTNGQVRIEKRR